MFINILPAIPFLLLAPTSIGNKCNNVGYNRKGADLNRRCSSSSDGKDALLNSANPTKPSTQLLLAL